MSELSTDEKLYYVKKLEEARDIVLSLPGGAGATTELVAVVFEKIASPLVYLRQDMAKNKDALKGDFSHETPGVNDEKEAEKEREKESGVGYERKARLLAEGWKESKNPDIVFKTVANTTFFEDVRTGKSWISKHAEAEK